MINLFVTRRQLFLLAIGTPLATVVLFVLGVYSGAAISAPGITSEPTLQPQDETALRPALEGTRSASPTTPDNAIASPKPHPFAPASRALSLENNARTTPEPGVTDTIEAAPESQNDATDRLYSIQAGVFSELSNARQLTRELEARGYDSRLEVVDTPEQVAEHFRIRIGLYDSRAAADSALQAYRQDGGPDAFIVSRTLDRS